MTKKTLKIWRKKVADCKATVTIGTRYVDGGKEIQHGLPVGSEDCTCPISNTGSAYIDKEGNLFPSLFEANL